MRARQASGSRLPPVASRPPGSRPRSARQSAATDARPPSCPRRSAPPARPSAVRNRHRQATQALAASRRHRRDERPEAQIICIGDLRDEATGRRRAALWRWRVQQARRCAAPPLCPSPPHDTGGQAGAAAGRIWSQQQDRQRAVEGDEPVHQAQADLHGDKRSSLRRRPVRARASPEGRAQQLHRSRAAEALADLGDGLGLLLAAPEELERRQPLQHVEEVRAHPAQLLEPALAQLFRARPDDGEQEDEQRAGDDEDQPESGSEPEDDEEDQRRTSTASSRAVWYCVTYSSSASTPSTAVAPARRCVRRL